MYRSLFSSAKLPARLAVFYFATAWLFASVVFSAGAFAQASSAFDKVGEEVAEALKRTGRAKVVIMLADNPAPATNKPGKIRGRPDVAKLQDQVLSHVGGPEYVERRRYRTIPALSGTIHSERGLQQLASNPNVVRIDLDQGGRGSLGITVPLIRANTRHQQGVTGDGVVVAVLDSGLDTDHIDLGDDLDSQACFLDNDGIIDGIGLCPNGSDRQFGPGSAEDDAGHGTFTTGIITSNGTVSGIGVAPDADIVSIKVLDDSTFSGVFFFFSEIVAALDYIAAERPDVQVINMSLGSFATFAGDCDNATAYNMAGAAVINRLRENGVIAFASSGNGASSTHMTSPACLSNVIAVGATDNSDQVASFTSSNASTDLMAPGVSVVSAGIGNTTVVSSGTSFATAHAAGCAALLIDSGEATTPDEIETRLKQSTVEVSVPGNGLTFPRIDCGVSDPDHYLLYGLSHRYDDQSARGQVVHLSNGFGSGYFGIGTITRFANPVDKNQEGINFQDLHYVMYRIRGESFRFRPMRVIARNQFGNRIHLEARQVDRLMVPSAMSLDGLLDPLPAGSADAMNCYRLKKTRRLRRFVSLQDEVIRDQLGDYKGFIVREPRRLCSPVRLTTDHTETRSEFVNPDNSLLCYAIHKARHEAPHLPVWGIDVNNILQPAVLETTRERELCVPTTILSTRVRTRLWRSPGYRRMVAARQNHRKFSAYYQRGSVNGNQTAAKASPAATNSAKK